MRIDAFVWPIIADGVSLGVSLGVSASLYLRENSNQSDAEMFVGSRG